MFLSSVRVALIALLLVVGLAPAADQTWTNGAGGLVWTNGLANDWTPIGAWNNTNVDSAIFGATGAGTITVSTPITLRGMNFTANGFTINGSNTLTLTSGGGGSLGVGEIQVASGDSATINAVIGGSVGLTKTNSGTLTLGGLNTFTGDLTINGGTVVATTATVSSASTLGSISSSHNIVVTNGGTLSFTTNNVLGGAGMSAANLPTLFIGAGGIVTSTRYNAIGNVVMSGGTLTQSSTDSGSYQGYQFLGSITYNNTSTASISTGNGKGDHLLGGSSNTFNVSNAAGTLVVSAALIDGSLDYPGAGALNLTGSGTLILSAPNTYSGGTTVSGGTLQVLGSITGNATIASGATLQFANSSGGTLSGAYSGQGSLSFTGIGISNTAFTLTSTSNTWSGGTLISNCTVQLGGAGTFTGSGTLTLGSGTNPGVFRLAGNNQIIGGLASSGTGASQVTNFGASGTSILTINQSSNTTFGGQFGGSGANDANFAILKSGTGTLTLTNASNNYTGGTTISGGTLSVSADGDLGATSGNITLVTAGALLVTGTGFTTARGFTVNSGGGSFNIASGATLTVTGVIASPGGFGIGMTGPGTLVLANSGNGYGNVNISNGVVSINADGDLGGFSGLTINGGSLQLTATGTVTELSASRTVTLGSSGGTIDSSGLGAGSGNIITVASSIDGNGNLALKAHGDTSDTGNGSNSRLILSGTNSTFTGTVTIYGGVVDVTSNFGFANNSITLSGGGLVATTGAPTISRAITLASGTTGYVRTFSAATLTLSGAITGSGGMRKTDGGILILTNTGNNYAGGTTVGEGTLQLGNNGALPSGGAVTIANGTLNLNGFNQTIGALNLGVATTSSPTVTTGAGTLTLGGSVTFDGGASNAGQPATITGYLNLGGGGRTFSVVNPSSGAYDLVVGAAISGGGGSGLICSGSGFVVLNNGSNSYNGPTTVNSGILATGAVGALPSTTALTINGGSLELYAYATSTALGVTAGNYNQTVASLAGTGGVVFLGSSRLTVNGSASTTFSGSISDDDAGGFLFKIGTGTLTLSGTNSYTGGTIIGGGGTLQIGAGGTSGVLPGNVTDNAALVFNRSDNVSFGGQITGSGSLTQAGTGTLTLTQPTAPANAYSGGTFVTGGTLLLGTAAATQIPKNGNVTVSAGAIFDLGSPSSLSNFNAPIGTIALNGGTLRAEDLPENQGYGSYTANSLVMTGGSVDFTAIASAYFYFTVNTIATNASNSTAVLSATTTDPQISSASGAALTINVAAGTTPSGIDLDCGISLTYGSWIKAGPGVMRLAGPNDYSVALTVAGGKLRIDDVNTLNMITNPGAGYLNSLSLSGGTLQYGGTTATSAPNPLTLGSGGGTIEVMNAGTTLTLANPIAAGGGLTKTGPGTLILTNSTSDIAGVTVTQGILSVAADSLLGSTQLPINIGPLGTFQFSTSTSTSRTFVINSGTLQAPSGTTLTLNGATLGGGFLRGTFAVTGGTYLSGVSTINSTVINQTGSASYNLFSNGGPLTVAANQSATMSGFTNQGSGTITMNAGSQINAADFQTYGVMSISNGTSNNTLFTNTGTTPLYFNGGSQTFVGTIGGNGKAQLELNGNNAIVAGGLFVNNGHVTDNSTAGISTIIAEYGALVKGAGVYDNSPQTLNGGKFQSGNSPGVATVGRFVFGPGGVSNYVFAIDDATGQAGPTPDALGHVSGWGLVKTAIWQRTAGVTSGDFVWTAYTANPLTVAIDTLVNPTTVGTDVPGLMADFDPTRSYSWPAVEWTGSYSGPSDVAALDAATNFDTSGFANPINGTFGWSLSVAQVLNLSYTPSAVPEPGTLALVGLAAAVGCRRLRRGNFFVRFGRRAG